MSANFSSPIPGRIAPKGREPNLPGDRYGRLTLQSLITDPAGKPSLGLWLCVCDCGNTLTISHAKMRAGRNGSCACIRREAFVKVGGVKPGQVFGRLTVVSLAPVRDQKTRWNVSCICGKFRVVDQGALKTGNTTSCGCLATESKSARSRTHGLRNSAVYKTWSHIKDRCTNPRNASWEYYGGRGITLYPAWHTFENFYADVGDRPEGYQSIDRIDNNKGYEPGNWRWSTAMEQSRNKRTNVRVSHNGTNICLKDAATLVGIPYHTVYARLSRGGWSISQALESSDFSDPI